MIDVFSALFAVGILVTGVMIHWARIASPYVTAGCGTPIPYPYL